MKKYILIPTLIIVLAVVFSSGYFLGHINQPSIEQVQGLNNKQLGQPTDVDFGLFWDAWRVIEKDYVDRNNLNRQSMVYGAINGLVKALGDPYSVFMEPTESKQFVDDMSGSFDGIGAEIGIRKDVLTIIAPLEGNPAEKAGLKAGDKVLKINDTLTAGLSIDEAIRLIRGPRGTAVTLLIARDEWEETKEFKITRDTIKIPIISWQLKDDSIGYIRLSSFTQNSSQEFSRVVTEILKSQPKGLILDLRNNGGGYLEMAVDIASWFIPKGEVVVSEDFGDGEKNEYRSNGYEKLNNLPTVVLINEGSASASEILAGALRDIKKTKLVGKKSFGKGSVQQLENLKGGSSIKITVAKWLTPNGFSISQKGIEPDVEVDLTSKDIDEMKDPQLDKALELLR